MAAVSLEAFLAEIDGLRAAASAALEAAADDAAVEAARVEFLGARSGRLKAIQKMLGGLDAADKPAGGKHFNEAKNAITSLLTAAQERLATGGAAAVEAIDVTLPGAPFRLGHLHPITQTIRRVQEIMARLGFESVTGPEVEDQW
ncbi:MAG: phenylalanine--tRNA ligase subunit alpha, partial [Planctomycetia bacterium]